MFRFILPAYLSLIAALGPALCCCSFRHLAGTGGSDRCCVAQAAQPPDEHHHSHGGHDHDGHSHAHHHHHAPPEQGAAQQADLPAGTMQIGREHSCGCDRDKDQLSVLPKPGERKAQLTDHWAMPQSWILTGFVLRTARAEFREQATPPLYGRGILRAYQILVI